MTCKCTGSCTCTVIKRCPWTGNPCDCNDVEAFVNCIHNPEVPNVDETFDDIPAPFRPGAMVDEGWCDDSEE